MGFVGARSGISGLTTVQSATDGANLTAGVGTADQNTYLDNGNPVRVRP